MHKMLTSIFKYGLYELQFFAKIICVLLVIVSCSERSNKIKMKAIKPEQTSNNIQYLALGDSYTIGEAVDEGKSFPLQLAAKLNLKPKTVVQTKIIATTGWRTDQLIAAIEKEEISEIYDFVTLLIGVNNQFQNTDFGQYEKEFPDLLEKAIELADNNTNKVLVLSIPDYGFTPFGEGKSGISKGIDKYNAFAKKIAIQKEVAFLNITDITRRGLQEPKLVASDNLHVSAIGYAEFVERIIELKFSE